MQRERKNSTYAQAFALRSFQPSSIVPMSTVWNTPEIHTVPQQTQPWPLSKHTKEVCVQNRGRKPKAVSVGGTHSETTSNEPILLCLAIKSVELHLPAVKQSETMVKHLPGYHDSRYRLQHEDHCYGQAPGGNRGIIAPLSRDAQGKFMTSKLTLLV